MAIVNQIASGRWVADAATVWSTGVVPAAGDQVFALIALDLTVDDDTNVLFSFELSTSNTLTIDATKTLETTGYVNLVNESTGGTGAIACGGNFDISAGHAFTGNVSIEMTGTGTFTDESASPGGANLEINTAGTVTLGTDVYCVDFTRTLGEIVPAGFEIYASGNALHAGGTGHPSITQTGTGSANWNSITEYLASYTVAVGAVVTIPDGGIVYVQMATICGTLTNASTGQIRIYLAQSGWWGEQLGILDCDFSVKDTQLEPGNDITLVAGNSAEIRSKFNQTMAVATCFNFGGSTFKVWGEGSGDTMTLNMNGTLVAGASSLGVDGAGSGSGILNIGGMASMASLASNNAANTANAFSFGAGSHVEFSGLADFANIAVTASTNLPPEIVCGPGGKVTNCEPDNEIALFGDANVNDTPGTNNLNITNFVNNQSYPGSLMTMGIGGGRLLVPFLLMAMVISCMMMKGMC